MTRRRTMADNTKIEWTDATWTPIRARLLSAPGRVGWHCVHKSPGCANCYSEAMNKRLGTGLAFKPGHERDVEMFLDDDMLLAPLRWRAPRRVFVCSMTDLFADFVTDEWIDRMFAVMALCPQHTFQVLTKRPARMRAYIARLSAEGQTRWAADILSDAAYDMGIDEDSAVAVANWINGFSRWQHAPADDNPLDGSVPRWPLPNVWLGASVEDQQRADERIPDLLATPAAKRFISAEPLLGPIDIGYWLLRQMPPLGEHDFGDEKPIELTLIDWVIVGGESGPGARPMHPDWARSLRDQCAAAGVAFFFKQFGAWVPHTPQPGGNLGADVRAGRVQMVNPSGRDIYEQSELTGRGGEPGSRYMRRVGKRAAGRLLDGREHSEFPA